MTNQTEALLNDTMTVSSLSPARVPVPMIVSVDMLRDGLQHLGDTSKETEKVLRQLLKALERLNRRKPLIHNGKAYRK